MTEAMALARVAGLRPTPQRVAIIEALDGKERPLTAQELHGEVRDRSAGLGLATVYRTLRALADSGVAQTFPSGDGELGYKLCEPAHHHHLICDRCGQVVEIPSCDVEPWATAVARRRGFTVSGHRAEVYGVCEACRRRAGRRRRG